RAAMGGADRDRYSRLQHHCVEDGWTVSKLETLATVVGAFAAWCTSSRAVWTVPGRVGPGSSRSTERSGPVEFPPVLRTPGVWSLGSSRRSGATGLREASRGRFGPSSRDLRWPHGTPRWSPW